MNEPARRRRGCLYYGCLGAALMPLIVLIAAYLGFHFAVARFTDSSPLALPKVRLSAEDSKQLRDRIEKFNQAVAENKSTGPLVLTANEANALIQSDPDLAFLNGQVFLTFESNRLGATISMPADKLGSPRLRGRYLNATGTFTVSLRDGQIEIHAESLSAKGQPVSEHILERVQGRNFAAPFTNATVNAAVQKLRDIQIKDGKLIVVPKQ